MRRVGPACLLAAVSISSSVSGAMSASLNPGLFERFDVKEGLEDRAALQVTREVDVAFGSVVERDAIDVTASAADLGHFIHKPVVSDSQGKATRV